MLYENLKGVNVVHVNCYFAEIDGSDVFSFYENDEVLGITFKSNYQYEDHGYPRWKSIEPLDKDEITSIQIELQDGTIKSVGVPFKDVSPNGAYCINEKSIAHQDGDYSIIEWRK